jgi:hypothetical protein
MRTFSLWNCYGNSELVCWFLAPVEVCNTESQRFGVNIGETGF